MPATVEGQASLKGLQHAEQNSILSFFANFAAGFKQGTITLMGYMKTTAVVMGVAVPALTVSYSLSGLGSGAVSGNDVFVVPGPEVGSGISFLIVACLFALSRMKFFKSRLGPSAVGAD